MPGLATDNMQPKPPGKLASSEDLKPERTSLLFAAAASRLLLDAFSIRATSSMSTSASTSTRLAATATANETDSGSWAPRCRPVTMAASPRATCNPQAQSWQVLACLT